MAIYSANAATVSDGWSGCWKRTRIVDMMREKVESWGIKDYDLYNSTGLSNSDLMGHMYPGSNENSEKCYVSSFYPHL